MSSTPLGVTWVLWITKSFSVRSAVAFSGKKPHTHTSMLFKYVCSFGCYSQRSPKWCCMLQQYNNILPFQICVLVGSSVLKALHDKAPILTKMNPKFIPHQCSQVFDIIIQNSSFAIYVPQVLNDVIKLFPFYLSKVSIDICAKFVIIMFSKFQIGLFQFMFKTLTPKFYHCSKIFLLVYYLLPICIPDTQ